MARRKKSEATADSITAKNRRRKAEPQSARGTVAAPTPGPDLAQAERELVLRYPHLNVVPGSLRLGASEGWGTKRVFDLTCPCGSIRTLATSDAHSSPGLCRGCAVAARKARKKKAG